MDLFKPYFPRRNSLPVEFILQNHQPKTKLLRFNEFEVRTLFKDWHRPPAQTSGLHQQIIFVDQLSTDQAGDKITSP
jgi:hypothetical protein